MESAEAKVKHVIFANVNSTKEVDGQFFVHFVGSYESILLGPGYAVGDVVKITFEKQEPINEHPKS